MDRREFLGLAAGAAIAGQPSAAGHVPIIDTHIHLFDPTRPQGVPWPAKDDAVLYRPALPERYRKIARPLGVVGAIVIEASPWVQDNEWVLDVAAKETIIVGTVGNLDPGTPDFRRQLEELHRNPLFRGIRYGNLWGKNLATELEKPKFVSDVKGLAETGLELDTANPDPALIRDILRLSDRVPDLRIVIDHLPQLQPPVDEPARIQYQANFRELGKRPQIYVKVSEVIRRVNGKVVQDAPFYKPVLDDLWETFGPDRLIYGSDWPNSDNWAGYEAVLNLVRAYFEAKGPAAEEKFFWKNAVAAYRWIKREPTQPSL
jgi:predicted TIM-barrel fold metal-dependent hydrolase